MGEFLGEQVRASREIGVRGRGHRSSGERVWTRPNHGRSPEDSRIEPVSEPGFAGSHQIISPPRGPGTVRPRSGLGHDN